MVSTSVSEDPRKRFVAVVYYSYKSERVRTSSMCVCAYGIRKGCIIGPVLLSHCTQP